jgi:hypothetical protein
LEWVSLRWLLLLLGWLCALLLLLRVEVVQHR